MRVDKRLYLLFLLAVALLLRPATAIHAQAQSGITSPAAGSSISGDVPILGTAVIDPFQKYELHYKLEPSGDDGYIYFDGGTAPVVNGQIGIWRASALPAGTYSLRLRVVKADGNYAEFFAPNISVNQGPAPTPTSSEPTPTAIPTATFTPAPQPSPEVGQVEQPQLENPLLPTPTPTTPVEPAAVVVDPAQPAGVVVEPEAIVDPAANSLTRELGEALAVERLRRFFFTGIRISATIFVALAALFFGRWLLRTVRRQV